MSESFHSPFKGENLMRFVTSIKYTANIAKMVNNITFMYDPNWHYGMYEQSSLPISFYFVKKWEENSESDVSTKPMMFYNSQGGGGGTAQRNGAVMNVVADNIINQPKTYRMEVLVPFTPDGVLSQYQFDPVILAETGAFALSGNAIKSSVSNGFAEFSLWLKIVRALLKALSADFTDINSITSLILQQNDINKVSLDAMRDNRGIIKMKTWNGWRFKYVMIKSINLSKSGDYFGFYEGSIVVQEVPVLNVYQKDQISEYQRKGKSILENALGDSIKKPIEAVIGTIES